MTIPQARTVHCPRCAAEVSVTCTQGDVEPGGTPVLLGSGLCPSEAAGEHPRVTEAEWLAAWRGAG